MTTCDCLLIFAPTAKPCEPPAGLARLAGAIRGAGKKCILLDANIEGLNSILTTPLKAEDTWSRRAVKNITINTHLLRSRQGYTVFPRYQRAVADLGRVVALAGRQHGLDLQLANYRNPALSPLNSQDLLQAAALPADNIFYPYFAGRLQTLINQARPGLIGFSLNFLSQALTTFAMIGFVKTHFPEVRIVVGGGLITSWQRNHGDKLSFAGLIDHLIAGPGEQPLLALLGNSAAASSPPSDYSDLVNLPYLAPGFILPYAASSGCYWNKCTFCPEPAEGNPYTVLPPERVIKELSHLCLTTRPTLIHFLDNAISPALMTALIKKPPATPWYGFARADQQLADPEFCLRLRNSGCLMLKLGLESGDQGVLDAMDKGIDLALVDKVLAALHSAGIATYVYLLFGTPTESRTEAERTMAFTIRHAREITFLNLAIFNMPTAGGKTTRFASRPFDSSDLGLYRDFIHPRGWDRKSIRRFLDRTFKKHPAISPIIRRDPPIFTSNHAPFFLTSRC